MYTRVDTFPTTACSGSPISTAFYPASTSTIYCTPISKTADIQVFVNDFVNETTTGAFCVYNHPCSVGQCDQINGPSSCTYGTTGFNVLASWPQFNSYEWLQITQSAGCGDAPITTYYPLSVCTFVNTTAGYQQSSLVNGNQIQHCTASNSACTVGVSCHVYDLNTCTNAGTFTVLPAPVPLPSSTGVAFGSSAGGSIPSGSTATPQSLPSSSTGELIPISSGSTGQFNQFNHTSTASTITPPSVIASIVFVASTMAFWI